MKRYHKRHPNKWREWYDKNKERVTTYKKIYRQAHPELKEKHKIWYQNNLHTIRAKNKKRIRKIKIEVLNSYSNGLMQCQCCKEKIIEFLTIDHLPNAPHKRNNKNRSGTEFYSWLKKHNYPEGFRVLCMNCNFSYGKYGYCPHTITIV